MGLKIKKAEDKDGTQYYPQTHEKGVIDDNGTTLETKLQSLNTLPLITSNSASLTISPNTYYSFGEMASLTIALSSPVANVMNEYSFEFDSGSTATTLSLPDTVIGINITRIAANKHYEVSIKYDASSAVYYGLISEW